MAAHETHGHHDHREAASGKRKEHRFVAEPTSRTNLRALFGGVGVASLGAAAYAAWAHDAPMPITPYLLVGSAIGILIAWSLASADAAPLRVGDAGVAVEQGQAQPMRIGWWEIETVKLDGGGRVVVEGGGRRIVAAPGFHTVAAGWIIQEALARVPKRIEIDAERSATIARAAGESAGTVLTLDQSQVTGRRCKASGTIISFERDAIVCPRCGEVYDKRHVPPACLTCEARMAPA